MGNGKRASEPREVEMYCQGKGPISIHNETGLPQETLPRTIGIMMEVISFLLNKEIYVVTCERLNCS